MGSFISVADLAALRAGARPPALRAGARPPALRAGARPPVVLDVRFGDGTAAGHIPGAVHVDLSTQLAGPETGLSGRRPLPDIRDLEWLARSWGIDDGDTVVVYDTAAGTKAGRAWWVLRWAGLADVRILDGGLAAWTAAGLPVTSSASAPSPGSVTLTAGHLRELTADEAAEYAAAGRLLDARGAAAYAAGHIPGAVSAPTRDALDADGLLLDTGALRRRFADLGVDGSRPVGLYCGGGVAAAHAAAVLHAAGIETALFVGSFSAWSADPSRPVATGSRPE
ncbi:sulfurtransferase [Virgisporangium ochraceum]|uniref:thiosulfate sulfurtransferase n=1 Tax=Virgisporangium ochraceum TaxID=65505 RepID=A0A8J3ZZP2_9ACTN|nr:rhodanese-like domain-containing protein [Virgisporangium ochraceum]GIJ71168.1 sulfurtransferase [Virgisporangium ochraceum]